MGEQGDQVRIGGVVEDDEAALESFGALLEAAGYEVLIFAAVGTGGRTMESLIESGLVSGVCDITTTEWADELGRAGIAAHKVELDVHGLMQDPLVLAQGLSVTRRHDVLGRITTTAPGQKLSRTPVSVGRPAPKPGSDAASVLAEIGMADAPPSGVEILTAAGAELIDG